MSTVHLIVLQHGLWGFPGDVANLTEYLRKALELQGPHEDELVFATSGVNARRLTYDGIDVCGARLAQLVQDTVKQYAEQGKKVTKLSLIGYSLGGVISRFAAGKLYVAGVFEDVQPMNLITIASPHLGSFREPNSWWARFFNSQVPIIASRTGRQLMLVDSDYTVPWLTKQQELHNKAHSEHEAHRSQLLQQQQQQDEHQQQQQGSSTACSGSTVSKRGVALPPGVDAGQPVPLLLLMSHPAGPFWRALRRFRTRICAANIRFDTMVPYCTAALCVTNPYEQTEPVPINPDKYPSVVRPAKPDEDLNIAPVAIRGRSRMFFFFVFVPMFPFFWVYSVTNGMLHHRQAKRLPLDLSWLQQFTAEHNPFSRQGSRQASRRLSRKLRHPQWQRQQQRERLAAAAELLEIESPAAAAAAEAGEDQSAAPAAAADSKDASILSSSNLKINVPAPGSIGSPRGQVSPFHAAAAATEFTDEQQPQQDSNTVSTTAAAAARRISAAMSLEQALTHDGVLEREGIIEEPFAVHQQQQWMAQQLFDKLPPCWVPERVGTRPPSSSAISSSKAAEPPVRPGDENNVSNMVVAEAPAAAAEVGSKEEAQTVITESVGLKPNSSADGQQQQQGVSSSSSGGCGDVANTPPLSPFSAAAEVSTGFASNKGFRSEGGWHRVDVWMGHMHAHAAIMIRDKRFDAESRDFFQYLADHIHL